MGGMKSVEEKAQAQLDKAFFDDYNRVACMGLRFGWQIAPIYKRGSHGSVLSQTQRPILLNSGYSKWRNGIGTF